MIKRLSRRKMITGTGALVLTVGAGAAKANLATENWSTLRPLFARHWHGYGQTTTANTESGRLTLEMQVDLNPNDQMLIDGRLQMSSRWDTSSYSAVFAIGGYCWGTETMVGAYIERCNLISGDPLPENHFWQGLTGSLQLYAEPGSTDHWMLDGVLSGIRDGLAFKTQLSDYR